MVSERVFVPTKLTLLTVLLASTLMLLGGAAVAPALDMIRDHFETGDTIMTLVVTLPPLGVATTGLITGALGDRIGKVKVLLASLLVFGVFGVASFFATDITVLLVERFLVGVGIGGITGCCSALITMYYSGEERVRVLSYQSAAMGAGVFVLEMGGGLLAGMGWNGPFLIYAIGLIIFVLGAFSLREPARPHFDGQMPAGEMKKDVVAACYIAIFISNLLMYAIPSMLATYISQVQGSSDSVVTGALLGINGVVNALMCLYYRRLIMRFPMKYTLTLAWILIAAGYLLFFLPGSLIQIFISTCLIGMGVGLGTTTIINLLSTAFPPHKSGKVMGGYSTFFNLGQFVSTFLIAALIAITGSYTGMYSAFGIIALVCAIVMLPVMARIISN